MKMVKFNESPTVAEERVQATYILLEVESGCARLVIPANYLTDARTAATSAVATKFLAREDAKVLGVSCPPVRAGARDRSRPWTHSRICAADGA